MGKAALVMVIEYASDVLLRGVVRKYSSGAKDQKRLRRALLVIHYVDNHFLQRSNWCQCTAGVSWQNKLVDICDDELHKCCAFSLDGALVASRRKILRDPQPLPLEIQLAQSIVRSATYTKRHEDLNRRNLTIAEFNDHHYMKFTPIKCLVVTAKRVVRQVLYIDVLYPKIVKELEEEFKCD